MAVPLAAAEAGRYLHWGVVQISLANALVILVMVLVFVAALLLPFPHGRDEGGRDEYRDNRDDRR